MAEVSQISMQAFLNLQDQSCIVDVRSPIEYMQGHIPKAQNIPLFSNEERSIIGTIYKTEGKQQAIDKGLAFVHPRLIEYVDKAKQVSAGKPVIVHCYRGGMRSQNFAWLLRMAGLDTLVLEGGYKQYRQFVLNNFNQKHKWIVLGGNTGSGKTKILKALKHLGHQIIDLENLASHKGSSFGGINENKQPSQQNFENQLFDVTQKLDATKPIIIEDESRLIGRNTIPLGIWLQMKAASLVCMKIPMHLRIQQLVLDYTTIDKQLLISAMQRIKDQLGGQRCKAAIEYILEDNLHAAAEIALEYYDRSYDHKHQKKEKSKLYYLCSESIDPDENARIFETFLRENHNQIIES
jgi:tRNA 2-selenouridine synthase